MNRLGFIAGMKVEAETISAAARRRSVHTKPLIVMTGGNAERAESAALEFAAAGVVGLVSYGIAGGLDPDLMPGDVLVADEVLLPDGDRIKTNGTWRLALTAALNAAPAMEGAICGSDQVVATAAHKASLFARTGARAVDMESHGVARAARAQGLPFLVVRAIGDPADRAVPSAAVAGLGAEGERMPFAVIGELFRHPNQLPQLVQLARDSNAALRRLATTAPSILKLAEN